MSINKIKKHNVSDAVLEEMKRLITDGEWKPGSKLPSENELARRMGVSRVSIRSALQRLSSIGLIESRQGEGTFVGTIDSGNYVNMMIPLTMLEMDDKQYVMEFRRIIESEQAALAAKRATDEDIKRLKENLTQMNQYHFSSQEFSDKDIEFHLLLAEIGRNPLLIRTTNILKDFVMESIIYYTRQSKENLASPYHVKIIEAIEAHDPDGARKAMKLHLDIALSVAVEVKRDLIS